MKLSNVMFQPNHNTNYSPLKSMLCVLSVLALAFLVTPVSAHANIIGPGGFGPPDVLAAPTGTLDASISGSYNTGTINGTYSEMVISATNNTFCSGCLDFVINFTSNSSSKDSIGRITNAAFGNFLTDVGYVGTSTGSIPDLVTRSSSGDVVGFDFFGGIPPGGHSATLVIETNATQFTSGTLAVIDRLTENLQGFQPVPEPASLALLGAGFLALGSALRRKK